MIKLYKEGDSMGIETDCAACDDFVREMSEALSSLIDSKVHEGDWEFQLSYWLPQMVEICCKLKGYKADVEEHRLITAGYSTGATLELTLRGPGKVVVHAEDRAEGI
jgi:hypothetical protein